MLLAARSPFRGAVLHPGAAVLLVLWFTLLAGFVLTTSVAPPSTVIEAIVGR